MHAGMPSRLTSVTYARCLIISLNNPKIRPISKVHLLIECMVRNPHVKFLIQLHVRLFPGNQRCRARASSSSESSERGGKSFREKKGKIRVISKRLYLEVLPETKSANPRTEAHGKD